MRRKLARLIIVTLYICSLLAIFCVPQSVSAAGTLEIADAKVFSAIVQPDDWIICVYYNNEWSPPYPQGTASEYFDIYFDTGTTRFKVPQADWGYKPLWIYISTANAANLTWQGSYEIVIEGNPNKYAPSIPSTSYELQPEDWLGSNLNLLDNWVRSTAQAMELYYNLDYYTEESGGVTYPTGEGILTQLGSSAFLKGMPNLDAIRPNLFGVAGQEATGYERRTYGQPHQGTLNWETTMGSDIASAANSVGGLVNISGRAVAASICFLVYIGLIFKILTLYPDPAAAAVSAVPVPLFGLWSGIIDLAVAGVLSSLIILLAVIIFWIRGT